LYFKESGAANIGKRSHSGHDFHSRNQELIGTEVPQTLRYIWFAATMRLSGDCPGMG
jgi:hypothetical protein